MGGARFARSARERARRVDLALVSVGDVSEDATLFREGLLPRSQLKACVKAGAVGDVLCHFIDAGGGIVDHPVNRRVIAVEPRRSAACADDRHCGGRARKVAAIRAALKATNAGVLVTDEAAARGLLGLSP